MLGVLDFDQVLDVQIVFMLKRLPLVDQVILGVEDPGVPGVNDILNHEGAVRHLVLSLLVGRSLFLLLADVAFSFDLLFFLLVLVELLSFINIYPHHVSFTHLVPSLTKVGVLLVLELLEPLQLYEDNVLNRALRRLFQLSYEGLGQQRISWSDVLV